MIAHLREGLSTTNCRVGRVALECLAFPNLVWVKTSEVGRAGAGGMRAKDLYRRILWGSRSHGVSGRRS